jgi:hypothetical protein
VPSRALHRIAAFSAPPKKGVTGHQFGESFRRQTHWPVFAAGILRRWCRLSRTGCCGARECGTSRNFGLEVRASMLALRTVNYSSHGASGVAILKTPSSGSWLIHGARAAPLASGLQFFRRKTSYMMWWCHASVLRHHRGICRRRRIRRGSRCRKSLAPPPSPPSFSHGSWKWK